MRKVLIIDGAHLKRKYTGCLLTASCQDGNYQLYPVAFGIVDGDNDKAWSWFFRKLQEVVPDSHDLVFVSDRHNSIFAGLRKVYPMAQHCACVVHLQRNVQSIFKKKHLSYLVSQAARAYLPSQFYELFDQIRAVDSGCADYLTAIGFEHWTRAHFNGLRYNIMTSNVAESLNNVLAAARDYPIVPLIEYIRATLMGWFNTRRTLASETSNTLTPKVEEILATNFELSTGFSFRRINQDEFEVRTKEGVPFLVNLETQACSCHEFQMLIPCCHAIVAALRSETRVDSLVGIEYTTAFWNKAYECSIYPVTMSVPTLPVGDDFSSLNLKPPNTRRPPGRPRKTRIRSRGQFGGGLPRRLNICGRCGSFDHNRASCKMPI
ncbi:uncharacterized protein LOC112086410 [Eutrema salsugineum]|uniref:uncharacterized protein LOC112086410 n=1 Tax=Eutrema salsugineum TaxID=72664 RepID=UPI000CED1AD7|nr:uncharacterized protein LOC112086410 [Eutrema salsugineum]